MGRSVMSRERLCEYGFEHNQQIHFVTNFRCDNPDHKRIAEVDDAPDAA